MDEDTCGVDDVYEGLLGAFTELVNAYEALDDFYSRKQEDGESIRDFSYAMMTLLDRAVTIDSGCVANKDRCLRDTFIEKLRDKYLRKHLKSCVRQNTGMSFKAIKEEALRWSEEDMGGSSKSQKKKR